MICCTKHKRKMLRVMLGSMFVAGGISFTTFYLIHQSLLPKKKKKELIDEDYFRYKNNND